jgi:hypothetical protein
MKAWSPTEARALATARSEFGSVSRAHEERAGRMHTTRDKGSMGHGNVDAYTNSRPA